MPSRFIALAITVAIMAACGPSSGPPNVVLIYVDDLGWRDLGVAGSTYYETPHVDRLAAEGMRFTDAYANAPNCAPSRAALLSGQYAPRTGIYTVGSAARGDSSLRALIPVENRTTLSLDVVTLPEALAAAGYVSGHIGKWHLGGDGFLPTDQGFASNVAGTAAGAPPTYFFPYQRGARELADLRDQGREGEYLTDRLTDEALRFLRTHRDERFFLYLSHYAVHTPIEARPDLLARYTDKPGSDGHDNPAYAAMIHAVDEGVGRILAALDSLDLADETVVIFYADNGGFGPVTSMAPLRGSKGMLYEGGIREPLIVRWPGVVAPGSTSDVPVIGLDLYPTLLSIAGAPPPGNHPLDGIDISEVLRGTGAPPPDRPLFWHFPAYLEADRSTAGPWRTTPAGAVRVGRFKLVEFFEDGRIELYDLADDAGERRNLVETMPDKASELHRIVRDWRTRTGATVPSRPNPHFDPAARARAESTGRP